MYQSAFQIEVHQYDNPIQCYSEDTIREMGDKGGSWKVTAETAAMQQQGVGGGAPSPSGRGIGGGVGGLGMARPNPTGPAGNSAVQIAVMQDSSSRGGHAR